MRMFIKCACPILALSRVNFEKHRVAYNAHFLARFNMTISKVKVNEVVQILAEIIYSSFQIRNFFKFDIGISEIDLI